VAHRQQRKPRRLPDDAIVIRGGVNHEADVRKAAIAEMELHGRYTISAASYPGWTVEQIARANRTPHSRIRKTTVGRLRSAGFEVSWPVGKKKHADLFLPDLDADTLASLEKVFDPPEPNPNRRPPEEEVRANGGPEPAR
jgi:hypothetical protein